MSRYTDSGAQRLWDVLRKTSTPTTVMELAEDAGISDGQARRLLRIWASAGLCQRHDSSRLTGPPGLVSKYAAEPGMTVLAPSVTHPYNGSRVLPVGMDAAEFAAAYKKSGLSMTAYGRHIGLTGHAPNINRSVRRMLNGEKSISEEIAAAVRGPSRRQ